jgi:hypothetical protein
MNLKPGGAVASIDGSHDGVRTRASPKVIITPKRIEVALRLAGNRNIFFERAELLSWQGPAGGATSAAPGAASCSPHRICLGETETGANASAVKTQQEKNRGTSVPRIKFGPWGISHGFLWPSPSSPPRSSPRKSCHYHVQGAF